MAFMSYFHGPLPSPQVCLCASVFEPIHRLKIERSTYAQTIQHAYSVQGTESEKMTQILPPKESLFTSNVKVARLLHCEGC